MYFITKDKAEIDKNISLTDEEFLHCHKVHRNNIADKIKIKDQANQIYLSKIISIQKNTLTCTVLSAISSVQTEVKIDIFLGLPTASTVDVIIDQVSQLSAETLHLFIADHTPNKNKHYWEEKQKRFIKIAKESSKQCERPTPLNINLTQKEALDFKKYDKAYLLDISGEGKIDKTAKNIAIIIGPEGGFSSSEINLFSKQNIEKIRLFGHILRTETAILSAISTICNK